MGSKHIFGDGIKTVAKSILTCGIAGSHWVKLYQVEYAVVHDTHYRVWYSNQKIWLDVLTRLWIIQLVFSRAIWLPSKYIVWLESGCKLK